MTIRNNNDNNSKSFASVPTEEEIYDAIAFTVNVDVSNEGNIPFAHATSVDFSSVGGGSTPTTANSGYGQLNTSSSATTNAAKTPIAYSTGNQPQPPPQQPPQPRLSSSSVATTSTTQTAFTAATTTDNRGSRRNNNSEYCTGWTCCGITCFVLLCIFILYH